MSGASDGYFNSDGVEFRVSEGAVEVRGDSGTWYALDDPHHRFTCTLDDLFMFHRMLTEAGIR